MTICQLCNIQLQKEVKCNPKTAQLLKKVCGPQEDHCEKGCEIQGGGQERNGCDGRLIAKLLITTIQGIMNLVLNHSETWRRQHIFT